VAGITKLPLHLRQQELRRGGFVYGVAVCTDDVRFRVRRAPDVGLRDILRMAAKTRFQRLFRREGGESADRGFAPGRLASARSRVIATWPVAALASRFLRNFLAGRDGFIVRIPGKTQPDIGMTGFADFAAHIPVGRLRHRLSARQQRQKQKCQAAEVRVPPTPGAAC
jgi:hypothetical protein